VIAEVVAPALPGNIAGDDRREAMIVPREQDLLHEAGAPSLVALDLLEPDLVKLCVATHKSTHVEHLVMWSSQRLPRRWRRFLGLIYST
jgi:hypothetical protein